MKRASFLQAFFAVLAIVFAIAVWLRLRALDETTSGESVQTASIASGAGAAPAPAGTEPATRTFEDPATYTIEPAAGAPRASQQSSREQRYTELLKSPPPPAPAAPTPPPDNRSLLERMVAPIASAMGMGKEKTPAQSAPAPSPAQQAQARRQARQTSESSRDSTSTSPSTSTSAAEKTTTAADDGETDIVPPQLLMAAFNPPQIQDDQETVLTVAVQDDRSGVRTVSGVIVSPSGSIQGFSCVRDGQTNAYTARVRIPPKAPEGTWVVKYLTLTDNTNNTVNLNAAQGGLPPTASFRVTSSAPDEKGPQLKAVWLDRQAMRPGDKNTVFVQADDDKSGVALVSGTFVSPSKGARIGFGCRAGSTGAWECPFSPPVCLDCGVWHLEQIQLQDKAQNLTSVRGENEIVKAVYLDIGGDSCDSTAPAITSLTLSPTVVSNAQTNVIRVEALVQDDGACGVASVSGQATAPGNVGGQRQQIMFRAEGEGRFGGTLNIPQGAAKGVWTVSWVQVSDKGNNVRVYSAADPAVSRATFTVE